MADIELVIKIPEELYETLKNPEILSTMYHASRAADAVRSGTPLPEHHGDLKDEREVVSILLKYAHSEQGKRFANFLVSEIKSAPTIIEADKEEANNADSD